MKHLKFVTLILLLLVSCTLAPTATPQPQVTLSMPTVTMTSTLTPTATNTSTRTPTQTLTPLPTATPQPVFHWGTDFENGYNDFYKAGGGDGSHRFGQFSYAEIVPDPTGSGRGKVYRGVVNGTPPPTPIAPIPGHTIDGKHRAYPDLYFSPKQGAFSTEFLVWMGDEISPAIIRYPTYISLLSLFDETSPKWNVSVMVDLQRRNASSPIMLRLNQSEVYQPNSTPFPTQRWVKIRVDVNSTGVYLYQDDRLISTGKLDGKLQLAGGHWGLYATGDIRKLTLLNDNITIDVYPTTSP